MSSERSVAGGMRALDVAFQWQWWRTIDYETALICNAWLCIEKLPRTSSAALWFILSLQEAAVLDADLRARSRQPNEERVGLSYFPSRSGKWRRRRGWWKITSVLAIFNIYRIRFVLLKTSLVNFFRILRHLLKPYIKNLWMRVLYSSIEIDQYC